MKNKRITKLIGNWRNYWLIRKIKGIFLLKQTVITGSLDRSNIQADSTQLYTLNDISVFNFAMAVKGELEYLHKEKKIIPESKMRFMDIYFGYIDKVGGSGEWKQLQKDYSDIMVREMIIKTSILFLEKNMFYGSLLENLIPMYGMSLTKGFEKQCLESELTNVLIAVDNITKRINEYNKQNKTNKDILTSLPEISKIVGYHIPTSILLIEYINYIISIKNERTNRSNNKRRGI